VVERFEPGPSRSMISNKPSHSSQPPVPNPYRHPGPPCGQEPALPTFETRKATCSSSFSHRESPQRPVPHSRPAPAGSMRRS
jgi:hypothetical protein